MIIFCLHDALYFGDLCLCLGGVVSCRCFAHSFGLLVCLCLFIWGFMWVWDFGVFDVCGFLRLVKGLLYPMILLKLVLIRYFVG